MYMRVVTIQGDPSRIEDVVSLVKNRVKPVVDRNEDGRGISLYVDRQAGRLVSASVWATQRAQNESSAQLAPLRAEAARLMAGTVQVAEYEVAVSEQVVAPQPGCWLRASSIAGDPARLRDAISSFQSTVIPALRDVPGFCGARFIVDRASGTSIGSTLWSSRETLEASRAVGSSLRGKVVAQLRAQVTGVAEYELVLAEIKAQRYEHLFRRAYEIISAGDLAELDEIIAEDFVEHQATPPGLPSGREGVKALIAEYRTAFPDLRFTMEKYLEQGEVGCAVVRLTGTNTGPLMGRPATGRTMDISAVDVVRVVDGRAVEHWGASDDLGMFAQLGVAAPDVTIPAQAPSSSQVQPTVKA